MHYVQQQQQAGVVRMLDCSIALYAEIYSTFIDLAVVSLSSSPNYLIYLTTHRRVHAVLFGDTRISLRQSVVRVVWLRQLSAERHVALWLERRHHYIVQSVSLSGVASGGNAFEFADKN